MPEQHFLDGRIFEQLIQELDCIFNEVDRCQSIEERERKRKVFKDNLDKTYISFCILEKEHYGFSIVPENIAVHRLVACCRDENSYQAYKRGIEAERARISRG